jgi:hypothetical protein
LAAPKILRFTRIGKLKNKQTMRAANTIMKKLFNKKFITALLTVCLITTGVFVMPMFGGNTYAITEQDEWASFRGNNNGYTAGATPRAAVEASLKWRKTFPTTTQWKSTGAPIIVGDYIYIAAGDKLYKIHKTTKKTVFVKFASDAKIGYTSFIAYGGGKIYVPLSGGDIQAFDAETLAFAWHAKYSEKTQHAKVLVRILSGSSAIMDKANAVAEYPNVVIGAKDWTVVGAKKVKISALEYKAETPVLYSDGRIYTGVYYYHNSSETYGTFFAINANDGTFAWEYEETQSKLGGFYWAGIADAGNYVLAAGDAGKIIALNKSNGSVNDSVNISTGGDSYARAGMTYVTPNAGSAGEVYIATKAGILWKTAFNEIAGKFTGAPKSVKLSGGPGASAPVIAGDKLYAFSGYINSGGRLDVFDKNNLKRKSTLNFGGYSQSFPLITSAYANQKSKKVFLYVALNEPGNDSVIAIEDAPNFAKPKAHTLYKPGGSQSLNSVIADGAGTLYFIDGKGELNALSSKKLKTDPTDIQGLKKESAGIKYYVDGAAIKGWKKVKGKKYYFGKNCIAKTGFATIGKKKYYFSARGVMQTGLKTVKKKKYYFGNKGAAIKGWKKVKGKKYYFGKNYAAKIGKQKINGKTYKFSAKGVLVK